MASDYGLNFGFRRSDESLSIREGRFRTPKTGTELLQGVLVEIDPANPGHLKQATANAAAVTGLVGLLVQEESHIGSVFEAAPYLGHDSLDLGTTKNDQPAVMWSGPGVKVWLKNTGAYSRGTRSKAAVQIVDLTGVSVGESLGWDGSKFVAADGTTVPALMTVTHLSGTDYVEAVLTF